MKKILPFHGLFYNQGKISSLAGVVSPPYDVIDSSLQDELYARSPYNFCRIDLTKEEGDARYEIAGKVFKKWLNEAVLIKDKKPGLYVHHHSFTLPDGQKTVRKGFFAVRRLEDFSEGGIKPHEKTLDGPKEDRLKLMRATCCQLSPVFSLYQDPEKQVEAKFGKLVQTTPYMDFMTEEGERHQLWKMADPQVADFVNQFLSDAPLFIADGHHRYETALNYRNEVARAQGSFSDQSSTNFIMMYFSNMNDDGLVILPIHRAIHSLPNFAISAFLTDLSAFFDVIEVDPSDVQKNIRDLKQRGQTDHAFWIHTKNSEKSYLAAISHAQWLETDEAKSLPESLAELDVSVLHQLVFKKILKISEESQAKQENIIYCKSTDTALNEARGGRCDLTFILNSTRIESMEAVAMNGQKMPQKSTFFYPKIVSGLVLHSVIPTEHDGY